MSEQQKYSGVGGQALLEGVMMKNGSKVGVAVRMPEGNIKVETKEYTGICRHEKLTKTPFLRGPINFIDSLVLGMKTLEEAAMWLEPAGEKPGTEEEKAAAAKKEKTEEALFGTGTVVLSLALSIGLFMLLPSFIAGLFPLKTALGVALVEGLVRILIFVGYVAAISLMKDIRRVFMYHGSEHKCINCIEHGYALTVENVRNSSKEHKRCGTSFLLFVMLVSIAVSIFLPHGILWQRLLSRLLMLPVVVSISYEFIRLAGRSDSLFTRILSRPGLWLQGLTTREPDDSMIEVGIASVEAVFDWKAWQKENLGISYPETEQEAAAAGKTAEKEAEGHDL